MKRIEDSEVAGTLSLNLLKETGKAMEMKLVYGFIPIDGSVVTLIERKSRELAVQIITRADQTMILEDQAISRERVSKSVDDLADQIQREVRRYIWN